MGLHVMEVPPAARAVVRSHHVVGTGPDATRVLQLQGGIRFAAAERVVREVVDAGPAEPRVVFDLTAVSSIDDVARRMLLEVARRLTLDGLAIYLIDPESILPDPDPGDGGHIIAISNLEDAVDAVAKIP
ncbi:STAS domain-containing protein [Kribbella amoyensis]|uniref:STAS domain-containing protein n=1 Tax=Kribbella amoyensis TaxID=996641 RepID=UPI003B516069